MSICRFDDVSATDNQNDGFTYRQEWIMSSSVEMVGPLNLDIASSNKLLLNRLNVNVKLQRTANAQQFGGVMRL